MRWRTGILCSLFLVLALAAKGGKQDDGPADVHPEADQEHALDAHARSRAPAMRLHRDLADAELATHLFVQQAGNHQLTP